jgi:hypothetical protein
MKYLLAFLLIKTFSIFDIRFEEKIKIIIYLLFFNNQHFIMTNTILSKFVVKKIPQFSTAILIRSSCKVFLR